MGAKILSTFLAAALLAGAGCAPAGRVDTAPSWQQEVESTVSGPLTALPVYTYAFAAGAPDVVEAPARGPAAGHKGAQAGDRLTVLSFNMQHRDDPAELAVMAAYLKADIIATPDFILCQEVLFERPGPNGQDNTAAVLAGELGCRSRGTKRISDREGVAIISRYPFAYYDERHLEARTSALLLGFRRVSVMGEFLLPELGRVRVVNVHFAYLPFEHHIRRQQLRETLAWLARRQREVPADITILGGDFNMKPARKEFAALTDPLLTGDLTFLDCNTTAPTRGSRGSPNARIDYIFVSAPARDVEFLGEQLLFQDGLWWNDGSGRFWISDHLPVLHQYAIATPAPAGVAGSLGHGRLRRP